MRALVLSGGSIKGAYEAGAILSIVEAGFYPDAVLGISTGALSAAFLVNAIGLKTPRIRSVSALPAEIRLGGRAIVVFPDTTYANPLIPINEPIVNTKELISRRCTTYP